MHLPWFWELTHNLRLFVAGPLSMRDGSDSAKTSTGTSETTTDVPYDPTVVTDRDGMQRYARGLNKYKAGHSPTTAFPTNKWTFQPGLSWLGHDEFESTGLAFKLARHQKQRSAALEATEGSNPQRDANKNTNRASGPRKSDYQPRARKKPADHRDKGAQIPQLGRVDVAKTKAPTTTKPGLSTGLTTSHPTAEPSPAPLRVDVNLTDFTSLFGASPSLPVPSPSISVESTPTGSAPSRLQLTLEQYGGDYSNLVSGSLVTSQGSPITYARSTMARRRDLGPDKRGIALGIIQGMISGSEDTQRTA